MILLEMDMPKSCHDCKLAHDEIYCSVTHKSVLDQRIDFRKERLPDCPIIDRLDLMCYQAKFLCECINDYKKTAPQ